MIDRYTKYALGVIAFMLTALVIQNATSPASAQAATCGMPQTPPCKVEVVGLVEIEFCATVAERIAGGSMVVRSIELTYENIMRCF